MKKSYSKVDLKNLYKEFGSIGKVAKYLDVPRTTVVYYFNKYRIKLAKGKGFPISKNVLIDLHEQHGSIGKVAAYLSKPYSTVRHWYHYHDIKVNQSGMTVFQEIRNTLLDDTQKSVVIGSLLGDGGLWLAPHCKNARLYVCHCEKQKQYLEWIHKQLRPFSRPIKLCEKAGKKFICGHESNCSDFYRFWTIAHPEITEVFKQYYRDGKKGVDESIINKVDLLAMAIWFADDGSIQRRNNEPYCCEIATCSFTYEEHLILKRIVLKFFDGKVSIKKHGGNFNGKPREDFILYMSSKKKVNLFLDMIKSVLPECIYYKLS